MVKINQKRITEPSDLHDENGNLIQTGWANKLLLNHKRENIKAGKLRIKDWDCYEILNPDFTFAFIIADVGYFGMATHDFTDFKVGKKYPGLGVKLFTKGSLNLPPSSEEGDVIFSHKGVNLKFERSSTGVLITIDNTKYQKGKGIKGKVMFTIDPNQDTMVNVVPFKKPNQFVYAQKIIGMPVEGSITVAGQEYEISEKNQSYGVLDWSRGVFPYKTSWYWGAGFGIVDGKRLGFNIDYGFGDESVASKNMIFLDGVGHKLENITFHYDKEDPMKKWTFTSSDGRFEMELDPIQDNSSKLSLGILKTAGHQVFGYYKGDLILDDGKKIHIDKILGFAENFSHRW